MPWTAATGFLGVRLRSPHPRVPLTTRCRTPDLRHRRRHRQGRSSRRSLFHTATAMTKDLNTLLSNMHIDRIRRSLAALMALALDRRVFLVGCGDARSHVIDDLTREASTSQPADDAAISTSGSGAAPHLRWPAPEPSATRRSPMTQPRRRSGRRRGRPVGTKERPSCTRPRRPTADVEHHRRRRWGWAGRATPRFSTTAMGGGGMMTMAEVEKIPVAAGTTVAPSARRLPHHVDGAGQAAGRR